MNKVVCAAVVVGFFTSSGGAGAVSSRPAEGLRYKDELLGVLVKAVSGLLAEFDEKTGHFGEGIWICRDQDRMFPLAVAYGTAGAENPYYKDKRLLEVITKAGDALIADADEKGQWVFRKKDGSTWGNIWMPWTYSRWVRSYALIRDDMAADRRQAWSQALTLGYTGISETQFRHIHNIPSHHAMGLYVAGQAMDRPAWCQQAAAFLHKVADSQAEGGYWSEHAGPVVAYNAVYMDALGTYYRLSGDEKVLPALERGATFHYYFRYPNGQRVETIDERNPYEGQTDAGNVGFTVTEVGRAYLAEQWGHIGRDKLSTDLIASLILHGQEGPLSKGQLDDAGGTFILKEGGVGRAATIRRGPWFVCLSAYTAEVLANRWIQDRQNLVSIYHDGVGLIAGGGNTKLQPAWSTITVGDTGLLRHAPGDTNPDFLPKGDLFHVPSSAALLSGVGGRGLDLRYGPARCAIRVEFIDDGALAYRVEAAEAGALAAAAHLTLIPHLGRPIATGGGMQATLGESPIAWSAEQVGGRLEYAGVRLELPATASIHWPALRHNPYRKDGRSDADEARIEVRVPLTGPQSAQTITIHVGE